MSTSFTVVVTDYGFADVDRERALIEAAGGRFLTAQCRTQDELLATCTEADALLVQYAPVDARVLAGLTRCKVIVRYGIGVDNIDLQAARAHGIPVCNVPDYALDEVADHAVSMALALARQLPAIDRRIRHGVWSSTPDLPMPAYREMTFATFGFGRIARATLSRVRAFGFTLAAYDPMLPDSCFADEGVERLGLEELFERADILSLHAPATPETHHVVNAARLARMKPTAVLVNTARGPLIDNLALARALADGTIAAAGLDVFDPEPCPGDHPLRQAPNLLMTSHLAWYSTASVPRLQAMAAEEVLRGIRGETLHNRVNP